MSLSPGLNPIVGIVADDVTGATDSVVQFSRSGWPSRLLLDSSGSRRFEPGSAVALTSDARPMDTVSARNATELSVENLVRSGADHLYLKIDSTMRGSVAGQLAGALSAWEKLHPGCFAVLCPAYPAMGRTVKNGLLRVHGLPVEDSPAGRDPVTPVRTSDLASLLPGIRTLPLTGASPEENARILQRAAAEDGMVAVDAATEAELQVLADALVAAGPLAIPAGSAGLAIAMARSWAEVRHAPAAPEPASSAPAAQTVVVVSSVHDIARAQAAYLCAHLAPADLQVLQPDPSLLHNGIALGEWTAARLAEHVLPPRVLLILSPAADVQLPLSGAAVARRLAAVVQQTVETGDVGSLVLVGGDGAHAVLDALSATSLLITGAVQEGIPRGYIEGGGASGRVVVTKAGGFGDITALLDTVNDLTNYTALPSETHS
ncbi:four-carbon acid sugar kinase family protein [Arthrobacter yangruifuii]|uniref:Four-carbon acid sugar kinase family protein n=1 Tax=Arthrobacter yangruifuii TaxID=2606616 RepID=A0A5N6MES1_9MICC|nr:four-carbon acid sugar kinase family protein [Arthrobacter yangruifuii]KAD3514962.1 four-carbon acid sugar kinase family protein [Arthrobacter yangruifuii]